MLLASWWLSEGDNKVMRTIRFFVIAACLAVGCGSASAADDVIRTKGSDTLFVVAQAWAEAYDRVHPEVTVSVGGGGSGTGFDALLRGLTDIANSSRRIESRSRSAAPNRYGNLWIDPVIGFRPCLGHHEQSIGTFGADDFVCCGRWPTANRETGGNDRQAYRSHNVVIPFGKAPGSQKHPI